MLEIVRRIVAEKGEGILADVQKLKPIFSDYAKSEPKQERVAFGRCIEMGAYWELKSVNSSGRQTRKVFLADKMSGNTGIDWAQYMQALDLLEEVLFPTTQVAPKIAPPPPSIPKPATQLRPSMPPQTSYPAPTQPHTSQQIFCNNCGTPLAAGSQFCAACGSKAGSGNNNIFVNVTAPSGQYPMPPDRKLRHGFTSFWLWIGFLGRLFSFIGLVVLWIAMGFPLEQEFIPFYLLIGGVGYSGLGLLGLINWDRSGFVKLTLGSVAYDIGFAWIAASGLQILDISEFAIPMIVGEVIYLAITFGILQFKNAYNAKSAWEQMY